MTPPMKGCGELEITTPEQADSIVENLNELERKRLLDALNKKIGDKEEKKESKKITKEQLLNKPNMTTKDKKNMEKSIKFLIEKKMDTSENLQKLDAIVYTSESIEIGGVKRARKDITAKPNGENIFQHNNVTYFQRSKDMIKEQNELLAKQGMEIPLNSSYEASMRALPGNYDDADYDSYNMVYVKKDYEGGNILAFITDMSLDGDCNNDGKLDSKGEYGYRWSASDVWSGVPGDRHRTSGAFCFSRNDGIIRGLHSYYACPIRPILK